MQMSYICCLLLKALYKFDLTNCLIDCCEFSTFQLIGKASLDVAPTTSATF